MQSTALRFRIVAFWIVCGAWVGCGSDPNAPLSDEGQVAALIYQFSDAARAPDSFATYSPPSLYRTRRNEKSTPRSTFAPFRKPLAREMRRHCGSESAI